MPELKPCPFCGSSEVELDYRVTRNRRYGKPVMIVKCKCLVCHASAKPFGYTDADESIAEERAIRAWNTRNQQDPVMDQLIRMYEAADLVEGGCEDGRR